MKILFATDGSEHARAAGRALSLLPLPPETAVTVLSAMPDPVWLTPSPLAANDAGYPWLADLSREEDRAARAAAEEAAAPLRERGLAVSVALPRRNPADALLEQAEEEAADLIVVGSHGMGAVERFLIGSVSERVTRYAHCSVLVVRAVVGARRAVPLLERVIVGVDGSESSEHALDALTRLPLPPEAQLQAIHVLRTDLPYPVPLAPGIHMDTVIQEVNRERRTEGERILRHAQDCLELAGRDATAELRAGAPADELVAAARERQADLIVVGAENRSALGRLFLGSVSARVLSHAPCSVLVARTAEEGKR